MLHKNDIALRQAIDTSQPSEEFQALADKALQAIASKTARQGADGGNWFSQCADWRDA